MNGPRFIGVDPAFPSRKRPLVGPLKPMAGQKRKSFSPPPETRDETFSLWRVWEKEIGGRPAPALPSVEHGTPGILQVLHGVTLCYIALPRVPWLFSKESYTLEKTSIPPCETPWRSKVYDSLGSPWSSMALHGASRDYPWV